MPTLGNIAHGPLSIANTHLRRQPHPEFSGKIDRKIRTPARRGNRSPINRSFRDGDPSIRMNKSFACVLLLVSLSVWVLSCGGGNNVVGGGNNGGGAPCNAQTGTTCESLAIGAVTRTYLLHVPSTFQKNSGALVIVLHGSGANGLGMETLTGFSTLSDQAGFAVAYPDGLPNASIAQTDWAYYFNDFSDDVGF